MKKILTITLIIALVVPGIPANAVVDKCSKNQKFKEIDSRTLQIMKKNLRKYRKQSFILQGLVDHFEGEKIFYANWYGKGAIKYAEGIFGMGAAYGDKTSRIEKLVDGDFFSAKVIFVDEGVPNQVPPIFIVCSSSSIPELS